MICNLCQYWCLNIEQYDKHMAWHRRDLVESADKALEAAWEQNRKRPEYG